MTTTAYARAKRSTISHIVKPESTQTRCGLTTYEMARWAPATAPRGVCRACKEASS